MVVARNFLTIRNVAAWSFFALISCISPINEASQKLRNTTAPVVGEQHKKSELSLHEFASKLMVERPRNYKDAQRIFEDFQGSHVVENFSSDIDLVIRSCGQTQNSIQAEIESTVCTPMSSTYTEFTASTFLMNNSFPSVPQKKIDEYFERVAASTLADFESLAESHGLRRHPLSYVPNVGHLPNPYSLSAFVDDEARLMLVQYETRAQIPKAAGSLAVVKVSFFKPDEINHKQ